MSTKLPMWRTLWRSLKAFRNEDPARVSIPFDASDTKAARWSKSTCSWPARTWSRCIVGLGNVNCPCRAVHRAQNCIKDRMKECRRGARVMAQVPIRVSLNASAPNIFPELNWTDSYSSATQSPHRQLQRKASAHSARDLLTRHEEEITWPY